MRSIGAVLALALMLGCDASTSPSGAAVVAYQVGGCGGGFGARSVSSDSCFVYDFRQTLRVQFCASANCCPDTGRFAFRHWVSSDTIYVVIADTAAHLCRCTCSYTLLMEFSGLDRSRYTFYCTREDYSSNILLYSVRVRKT